MLEVCVDSFESVKAAIDGGANRIELCSALSEGGLTPSVGLLKTVKSHFPSTKVFAMIRPHGKMSYLHNDIDMEIIRTDIAQFIEAGADGFVFGSLTSDRRIDIKRCQQVIQLAHDLPVTFHRAFDMTIPSERLQNIDKIVECGFQRLLTSGFEETAEKGIDTLTELNQYIAEKMYNLILMPGCGVTVKNAVNILKTIGCKEFHSSGKIKTIESIPSHPSDTSLIQNDIKNNFYAVTDCQIIRQLVDIGKMYVL